MADFDIVEFPSSDYPREGDTAPDFTRPLVRREYWQDVAVSDLTDEGPVALVFYPLNRGGKSMYTWNEIRDREWHKTEVTVVGVGIAQPFDQAKFIEERDMEYGIFSDPANGVAEAYDIVHNLDGMTGISEPRPAVFILDESRVVSYAWVATEWPDQPPYDEVEAELRAAERIAEA